MRKEYYNYVVKLPVLLHELFRGKVADYHFSDMTVVMNHLVKSYIRMTDGGRVSKRNSANTWITFVRKTILVPL